MKPEEFEKIVDIYNEGKDYGLCPQPYPSNKCLDILIEHLLGKDWYTTLPMGAEQVYTEATYEIIRKYTSTDKTLSCRLKSGVFRACRCLVNRFYRRKLS